MMRKRRLIPLAVLATLAAIIAIFVVQSRVRRNRYQVSVAKMASWKSYGGIWDLEQGMFRNNSDERGAKLMSGSSEWTDTSFNADVRMDQSTGDVGLMIRSSEEDLGVDAYNGYYVGLRAQEGTLIAGRSNYSWSEVQPVPLHGGIRAGVWYHLHLVMIGCRLAASVMNLSTGETAALILSENPCVPAGRVGLRSLSSGGAWRNLVVAKAANPEFEMIAAQAHGDERPQPLTTEVAYARHFANYLSFDLTGHERTDQQPRTTATHLGDLAGLRSDKPQHVVVRGFVTLTEPDLYIEDSTGGALVKRPQGRPVNVGEGVEISGDVHPLLYSAMLDNTALRIVSTGTPAPPLSITPWQAASGAYDARFVEVEGHLTQEPHAENGFQVLDLAEGGETFRALYPEHSGQPLHPLQVNSLLRLRGVCVLGRSYTQDLIPFLLFLRSSDDVQVVQNPPWWTPRHAAFVAFLVLVVGCSVQLAYFRFRQWQRDAIQLERERIAHDIHDTMAQSFAGIGYQIQGLRTSIIRNAAVSRDEIAEQLGSTSELVSRCHADASHTIEMLGAALNEEAGDLLGMLAERTYKLSGGEILVFREEQGNVRPLSIRIHAALFHIGQEAISNAITHGHPNAINFTLRYEDRSATLMIVDDGRGFEAGPEEEGFGILGMRHRAREIGGTVEILSAPGVGTRVGITFPLSRHEFIDRLRRFWSGWRKRGEATPARE